MRRESSGDTGVSPKWTQMFVSPTRNFLEHLNANNHRQAFDLVTIKAPVARKNEKNQPCEWANGLRPPIFPFYFSRNPPLMKDSSIHHAQLDHQENHRL
ncbi:MAG: hypothetical protein WCS31_00225 [Verrucomicrobiae bacterium]